MLQCTKYESNISFLYLLFFKLNTKSIRYMIFGVENVRGCNNPLINPQKLGLRAEISSHSEIEVQVTNFWMSDHL